MLRLCALLLVIALAACGAPPAPVADEPTAPPAGAPATAGPVDTPSSSPVRSPEAVAPTSAPSHSAISADLAGLTFAIAPTGLEFERPVHVTSAPDGSGRLFVVEQAGRIWAVRDGARSEAPFLDIAGLVGSRGNEQGLLSVAFHPRYGENGQLFVNYTDLGGDTVVARYRAAGDPERADAASAEVLLRIAQPAPNHNGGLLKFGPDGYLYIGTGDGGAAGDPWGSGQNLESLLGKILRIDVDGAPPYTIPPGNPFVGRAGARAEIWAWGLRNPWRFAFDRITGDLYIADVGQNEQEEVHFQAADSPGGANYGWNVMEGDACFRANSCDQSGLELPIAVYSHSGAAGGCSITGGYVYRGNAYPQIAGVYLYADYCSGNMWALRRGGDQDRWEAKLVSTIDIAVSSFGEDAAGELYLTDRDGGGLYRLVIE